MENGIINVEDLLESHEAGRRIGNVMTNETMTTHHHGSKAPHEIKGRNDFKIMHVLDECGDSPPNGEIELIQMWHRDRKTNLK